MSWYGDPDELHRLARRLAAQAEHVRARIGLIRSPSSAPRWRGPAADAFHAALHRECAALERAAGALDDAAAALHAHADAVREALARIAAADALREAAGRLRDRVTA